MPIRCFTCGAVMADKLESFASAVSSGEDAGRVLDDLGITRFCCRRMLLAHVDVMDEILKFYTRPQEEVAE
ncbi:MAG: DNA-directed RNA polymerase subunit N [Candidatus Bathyarchaeia archaeon]